MTTKYVVALEDMGMVKEGTIFRSDKHTKDFYFITMNGLPGCALPESWFEEIDPIVVIRELNKEVEKLGQDRQDMLLELVDARNHVLEISKDERLAVKNADRLQDENIKLKRKIRNIEIAIQIQTSGFKSVIKDLTTRLFNDNVDSSSEKTKEEKINKGVWGVVGWTGVADLLDSQEDHDQLAARIKEIIQSVYAESTN